MLLAEKRSGPGCSGVAEASQDTTQSEAVERLMARSLALALDPLPADEAAEQLYDLGRGDSGALGAAWRRVAVAAIVEPSTAVFAAVQMLSDAFEMAGSSST
ncbi:MAG: hypothetical protein ACRDZP_08365 [Acidimicrobiales bacterium]